MKRLMMATKGCGHMTSNDTYFSYRWFSSIKMAEEAMATGVDEQEYELDQKNRALDADACDDVKKYLKSCKKRNRLSQL